VGCAPTRRDCREGVFAADDLIHLSPPESGQKRNIARPGRSAIASPPPSFPVLKALDNFRLADTQFDRPVRELATGALPRAKRNGSSSRNRHRQTSSVHRLASGGHPCPRPGPFFNLVDLVKDQLAAGRRRGRSGRLAENFFATLGIVHRRTRLSAFSQPADSLLFHLISKLYETPRADHHQSSPSPIARRSSRRQDEPTPCSTGLTITATSSSRTPAGSSKTALTKPSPDPLPAYHVGRMDRPQRPPLRPRRVRCD